jgi:redox-sensitive bicupin YhaK (pirin superfamily)
MLHTRLAQDRGRAQHGWLDAWHSFSFSSYYDPRWMGFSALRVINEDRVAPASGFPPHGHRDMEIITYVLAGTLRHKDSTGGGADLRHGELQVMHAGSGVSHSETNPSANEPTHLLQIWIEPDRRGVVPAYEQDALDAEALKRGFVTVVAPPRQPAPFHVHQDASLAIAWPQPGQKLEQGLDPRRQHYLHVARGAVEINGIALASGDAAMLTQEARLSLVARDASEILLFDLP